MEGGTAPNSSLPTVTELFLLLPFTKPWPVASNPGFTVYEGPNLNSQTKDKAAKVGTTLRLGLYFLCPSAESSLAVHTLTWGPPLGFVEEGDTNQLFTS